jgi:hypothetical protein
LVWSPYTFVCHLDDDGAEKANASVAIRQAGFRISFAGVALVLPVTMPAFRLPIGPFGLWPFFFALHFSGDWLIAACPRSPTGDEAWEP